MKRKTTIAYAMTFVIVGLLITSAAGLTTMEVTKPATKTEEKNVDVDSPVAALLEEHNLDPASKTMVIAERQMSTEKTTVEAEATLVKLSEETPLDTKIISKDRAVVRAKHPGMGDDHGGNLALAYDYYNDTSGFDGLIFTLSDDYGENWTDTWTLVRDDLVTVYPASYPSIDYMDFNLSEGGNVFYATFNELTETFQNQTHGSWYNGSNISFMKIAYGDIDNPDVWVRTWTAFGNTTGVRDIYWHDMTMSDIAAADDFYFEINRTWQPFGLTSFVIDTTSTDPQDPSLDNGCNWFYPIEYQPQMGGPWINRYGLMWHYIDIAGAQATSTDIDKTPNAITGDPEDKKAYAVWDPLDDTNPGQHILLISAINMSVKPGMNDLFHYTGFGDPWDGVGWSMVSADLSLEYPEIAAGNDGEVVIAMEMVNLTDGDKYLSLWHCNSSDGNTMNISVATWDLDSNAHYPEVSWVTDHTYMVHWIMDNKLYAAFSYDGGRSWAENGSENWLEYYTYYDTPNVPTEERAVELADEASISIWHYVPDQDTTRLYYSYNTVEISGDVYDEFGVPVSPEYVKMMNINTSNNKTATLNGNHYTFVAILGMEIWTDAHILIQAKQGASYGDEYVIFGNFEGTGTTRGYSLLPILFVNTIDLQFGDRASKADFDRDGDVDLSDYSQFQACYAGAGNPPAVSCSPEMFEFGFSRADFDRDDDVDLSDYSQFQACYAGAGNPPAVSCGLFYTIP